MSDKYDAQPRSQITRSTTSMIPVRYTGYVSGSAQRHRCTTPTHTSRPEKHKERIVPCKGGISGRKCTPHLIFVRGRESDPRSTPCICGGLRKRPLTSMCSVTPCFLSCVTWSRVEMMFRQGLSYTNTFHWSDHSPTCPARPPATHAFSIAKQERRFQKRVLLETRD